MASRSTTVKFQNLTDLDLHLADARLEHGVWTQNMYPPKKIHGESKATWESESDGFMTGTEGRVTYTLGLPETGHLTISWDNPYTGSNKYHCSAPKGFTLTHTGGSGNNANVTFTFKKE
jgi:hypothetical protein